MHSGVGEEVGQMGWFRLWRDSNMHQILKDFEPDEVCDEGGVSGKSSLMARYHNELQGKERGKKTFARFL